jgi:hypothetical protein
MPQSCAAPYYFCLSFSICHKRVVLAIDNLIVGRCALKDNVSAAWAELLKMVIR